MSNDKTESIKWAINELSKQKEELEGKLAVARKRDETQELITEVHAQREALEKRISALEDGLKVSSELVRSPVQDLESAMSEISDKIEIARERLENLEQEEYFEELGRQLNGKQSLPEPSSDSDSADALPIEDAVQREPQEPRRSETASTQFPSSPTFSKTPYEEISHEQSTSTQTETMKSTQNRIQSIEKESVGEESSRLPDAEEKSLQNPSSVSHADPSVTPLPNLEETAERLGLEREFLVEKSMQAILRMIARNRGKLTFPLEVEQTD